MKILLIGCNGQIGWELNRTLQSLGEIEALDYPAIDLALPDNIREQVRRIQPQLIVNAAAYTAVDKAEEEPELAMAINGMAPGILAEEARRIKAALVHYSTDYVFDGSRSEPYTEDDTPNPVSTYGRSKWRGEKAVREVGPPHLVLRTSWVYGSRGKNFMLTMLRLAREKEEIRIVDDQIGSPTWCRLVAEATAQILAQGIRDWPGFLSEKGGLYHLCAGGRTSWFHFAEAILRLDPDRAGQKVKRLLPISTAEYPTPARRPAYSLLSCEALYQTFGLRLPDWDLSLPLLGSGIESLIF
ncbi:MAG: dTDP-4-dehydrorhamnose reductase [bacterium]